MSVWKQPCPYAGPAHDFEPLHINLDDYVALCRKCGVKR